MWLKWKWAMKLFLIIRKVWHPFYAVSHIRPKCNAVYVHLLLLWQFNNSKLWKNSVRSITFVLVWVSREVSTVCETDNITRTKAILPNWLWNSQMLIWNFQKCKYDQFNCRFLYFFCSSDCNQLLNITASTFMVLRAIDKNWMILWRLHLCFQLNVLNTPRHKPVYLARRLVWILFSMVIYGWHGERST